MNAKVMKEMLGGNSVQVKLVEVGEIGQGLSKTIPLDTPIKMIVVSVNSSSSDYVAAPFMKSGYVYHQSANILGVQITDSKITLYNNIVGSFHDVQMLLFH